MTPEEKAQELLHNYSFIEYDQNNRVKIVNDTLQNAAKQAAIICVGAIIEELEQLSKPEYAMFIARYKPLDAMDGYEKIEYWNKVLEILKAK